MIQKLLLNTQIIWMIFIKILKNKIQKKAKNFDCCDNMIADMHNNEKLKIIIE